MHPVSTPGLTYAGLFRRGAAYVLDCLIAYSFFAVTQVLVFAPLREVVGIGEDWFRSGLHTELYTLLTISAPVWLYFAVGESSRWQATPGKALARICVVRAGTADRIGFARALGRTVVKLLPWELAHLTTNLPTPLYFEADPGFRMGFAAVGLLMGAYIVTVAATRRKRGPHDLLAGTEVIGSPRQLA